MNQEKQPEALRLAEYVETFITFQYDEQVAAELRRLHAENTAQRAELVAEAARTAEEKLRADQMTEQHRMQCNMRQESEDVLDAAKEHIRDLEAQLSAIGAGGVEPLRKPSTVNSESPYTTAEESASVMRAKPETPAEKLVNQMIEDRWLNEQGVAPEAYTRGLFDIAAELAANMQAAQPSRECQQQSEKSPDWWRKRADEIELQVARSGSKEAMRCYTDMRTLLQSAAEPHCLTCNDHGAVGNILTAEPCPDCTPAPAAVAVPDAKGREK